MAKFYTTDHEWIEADGDTATVGISDYAQEQLGDVVYVELPAAGAALEKGKEAAVVESVKAASDVYAPVSGEVIETNAELADNPQMLNEDAEGAAWMMKLKLSDSAELDGLMDRAAYDKFLTTLG